MGNLRPEEENIIKYIINFFRLKKELNYTAIKNISVEKHLNKIGPYLKDIINNLKKSDTWKIQLTIASNFISKYLP